MNIRSIIKRFNSAELITFVYGFLTGIHILIFCGRVENCCALLLNRAMFFAVLFALMLISEKSRKGSGVILRFIRYTFPFALVAYWYPETYYLNHEVIVPNLDNVFDRLDTLIFGFSPAMEFSKAFPQAMVAEIMYLGYFSYYVIFTFTFLYFFFTGHSQSERAMFYCLCSFFIFYLIFIFVPVSGPQFYYPFPHNQVPEGYFFGALMRFIQASGEQPTGAFPSSHVGLTMIAMYLLFRNAGKCFFIILPFAIILVASTVYIKAHYLIDVIAAFILTPVIFMLSKKIYKLMEVRS